MPTEPLALGAREALRQRLTDLMLTKVAGFKTLVIDNAGDAAINSCFRMQEIMAHNITHVERLETHPKQPVLLTDGLYLMEASTAAVEHLVQDWAERDIYKRIHLFFTGPLTDALLARVGAARFYSKVATCVDNVASFTAPEPLMFHLNRRNELPRIVGSAASDSYLTDIAQALATVLDSFDDCPAIRCQDTSAARGVAARLQNMVDDRAHQSPQRIRGSTLLVVDRSVDAIAPLLHEASYQAMVYDFHPPEFGAVKLPSTTGPPKQAPLDEMDSLWVSTRHEHISRAAGLCTERLKKLTAENPALAKVENHGAVDVADLGDAAANLAQYKREKGLIEFHTAMIHDLVTRHRNLDPVVELEQALASLEAKDGGKVNPKTLLNEAQAMLRSGQLAESNRARMMLLALAATSLDSKAEMTRGGGPTDDTAVNGLAALSPWVVSSKRKSRAAPNWSLTSARYEPMLKQVTRDLAADTLSPTEFPFIREPSEAHRRAAASGASTASAGGGNFGGARTSRFGTRKAAAGPASTGLSLDLGYGETVELAKRAGIFVFVVGGATPSEWRSVYELTKDLKQRIVLGATSVCRPDTFVADLSLLGTTGSYD